MGDLTLGHVHGPLPLTRHLIQYPASPPLIITRPSNSSRSQGPYSTPVLYACEVVSPFHLDRDVMYDGYEFHRLEVGMRLGVVGEHGHPCMHPTLPVRIDDVFSRWTYMGTLVGRSRVSWFLLIDGLLIHSIFLSALCFFVLISNPRHFHSCHPTCIFLRVFSLPTFTRLIFSF